MRLSPPRSLVALFLAPAVSGLARTWRYERRHAERFDAARRAPRGQVFLLWHETLLMLLWLHRHQEIAIVVSEARDGAYLADYALRLGYRPISGSSRRGSTRAMRGVLDHLRAGGAVAITPDGPVGPRRALKEGPFLAAQRTGAVIVPVFAEARSAWRLGSWDRFVVPRPFARIAITYGEAARVGEGQAGVETAMHRAARTLASLEGEVAWPRADAPIG